MLGLIKWVFGLLLTLTLLIAIAVIVVPRVVDPNDYREKIVSLVKSETGRDLKLEGDLEVSVFPWLGISTQQLSLSQPEQIGGSMVAVEKAQIRVKLLPLFSNQVEIDTVILDQPNLRLVTLANGVNSFTGLNEEDSLSAENATRDPEAAGNSEASTAIALVIQGLELSNGNLLWDDRQAQQKYQVNDLTLITGNLIAESLANIEASGTIIDASDPAPLTFELLGSARIDTETLQVFAEKISMNVLKDQQNLAFQLGSVEIDQESGAVLKDILLEAAISVSPTTETDAVESNVSGAASSSEFNTLTNIQSLEYGFASSDVLISGVESKLVGSISDFSTMDLTTRLPQLKFNTETSRLSAVQVEIVGELAQRPVKLELPSVAADLQSQTASLESLKLNSQDLSLVISSLSVSQFIDTPRFKGGISLAPMNVAKLIEDFEIDYQPANPEALMQVAFESQFSGSLDEVSLEQMTLVLDNSQLTGSFAATNFDEPTVEFNLVLDKLNLDHYLPEETESTAEGDSVSGAEALAVPMAALKGINANGSFAAEQLISGGLEFNDIDVQIVSTPGNITITPKAKLYDGSLLGSMAFKDSAQQSQLQIKNQIDLVSLAKLLTAADVTEQLSGIGSLDLDLSISEKDGVQSNEGTIKLLARNGALKGVDIKGIIDRGYQQYNELRGKEVDETVASNANDETRFAELLGTFYLKDYKLRNDDFSLKAPLFRITGQGDIDIAAETVDYLVNVSIVNSSDGQGGLALNELRGLTIPVRLRGSLTAPSYSIDMKALYKGLAEKRIEDKKSEYLEEKLGIQEGGKLSTKDLLRQVLIKKIEKSDGKNTDQPQSSQQNSEPDRNPGIIEGEESFDNEQAQEGEEEEQPQKSAKDQLKDDLKQRLLDELFK